MRKILFLILALVSFSWVAAAKDKVPGDFKLVFRSSAGALERATQETLTVHKDTVTVSRNAEIVGEEGVKTKSDRVYKITGEQLKQLYDIVVSSSFFTWPKNPEGPHQSTVEEFFDITANGKTVTHGRWEQGNQEAFRALYDRYNSWFNSIRTARF
ncbi:MAG: hypothetical protein IT572_04950 [Deltaproteobacteria bacterium]|nr:hypothetical protein [Deltaproteobacteria bacterium]